VDTVATVKKMDLEEIPNYVPSGFLGNVGRKR